MRVARNQLISSVRALLRDVVLPEVHSELARSRLRQIMATLRDVDWDEGALTLLRENALLQELVQNWKCADAGTVPAAVPSFEEASVLNAELRGAIARRFARSSDAGWSAEHIQAARVFMICAELRGRKPLPRPRG